MLFNYNYPEYFNILDFDHKFSGKTKYDYNVIKRLYKYFKINIDYIILNRLEYLEYSNLQTLIEDKYLNLFYPIIYEKKYKNLYKQIIKHYEDNQLTNKNSILKLSLVLLNLLWYEDICIITYPIDIDLKMLIINSSNIYFL